MAALSSIQVEQLEQRVYPDLNAFLAGLTAAALPVFAQPNKEAVLAEIQAETGKSLLLSLELIEALPFVSNPNRTDIELNHPQEANPLAISYQNGLVPINEYFGYDPEEMEIEFEYSGAAIDLITSQFFNIAVIQLNNNLKLIYV